MSPARDREEVLSGNAARPAPPLSSVGVIGVGTSVLGVSFRCDGLSQNGAFTWRTVCAAVARIGLRPRVFKPFPHVGHVPSSLARRLL